MGVAGMIIGTLGSGWLMGRSQQQQAEAAAEQQERNAQIADRNADKLQDQADQQSQNNAINAENKRRRMSQIEGQQKASIGASGITATGSALTALTDSAYNMEAELGTDAYNGKQKVTSILDQSTDYVNQRNIYNANAANYRAAGKRAMVNSMLMSGFTLAGSLYNSKSEASQSTGSSGSAGFGDTAYDYSTGRMTYPTSVGNNYLNTAYGSVSPGLGSVFGNDYTFGTANGKKYGWNK